ncbi:M15 family metallopeptidase [Actinomadura fibrosa]|uniref:D-alanyl-D-alanine dipeptidase n=1 Tax=Actinomadura fibrosa TaxID=111802 RepID=A0ABW2XCH6_9ACTN|nr:M15 family metallopeptidase [Actinomadura fibrosa]
MVFPVVDDAVLSAAASHCPAGHRAAIPALTPESVLLRRAKPVVGDAEPLVRIADAGIQVLHSYVGAGWRHAVGEQWLRGEVLGRLGRAAAGLPRGFGFAVFDGWRPLALQRELFEAFAPSADPDGEDPVAPPSDDPAEPPPHLTGGAVDLTLTWQGTPLALGTAFDEFTSLAAVTAFEGVDGPVRTLRRLLYHSLRSQGFVVLAEEWWHFEFGTRLWSALSGAAARYGPVAPWRPVRRGRSAGGRRCR